ncbi:MAG TPA: porin, partial [Rhodoferax sp.]
FGVAKLVGDVGHVTLGNARVNEWTIGGYVPVSTALTLSAGFSKSTDDGVVANQDAKGFGIGAAYTLSKRTTLYAGFNQNKTTNNVTTVEQTNKTTAVGVLHTF